MICRRHLLHLTAGLAAGLAAGGAFARPAAASPRQAGPDLRVAPASAREARLTWARLVGDLSGKPIFFFTHGAVWGFKPQADDLTAEQFAKRLYGYSGIAARKFTRGRGGEIVLQQKLWAFYRDPQTDAITDKIPNPYTGAVDIAAPMSGPSMTRPFDLGLDATGAMPYSMRIRRLGKTATVETSGFARFKPANINWYKLEGNLEDYVCQSAVLDNRNATHIPNHYSQNVVAEWQTWTGMHGQPGHILFKGNGEPLRDLAQAPADQIEAIERFFAGSLNDVRGW